MSGLLYYIPGAETKITIDELRKLGLGHAFESQGDFSARGVKAGPGDAGGGVVIADPRAQPRIGFYPDEQTWGAISGSPVQIGYYTNDPPTPDDVARPQLLDGYPLKLGDGNDWLIPVARGAGEEDGRPCWYEALPKGLRFNNGQWEKGIVVAAYAPLWKIAQQWADSIFRTDNAVTAEEGSTVRVKLDFEENIGAAARVVLAANYRLDDAEIHLLGLFSDERMLKTILDATVDVPGWEAIIKKKAGFRFSRWLQYRRWADGRHRAYRPSIAELYALAEGL